MLYSLVQEVQMACKMIAWKSRVQEVHMVTKWVHASLHGFVEWFHASPYIRGEEIELTYIRDVKEMSNKVTLTENSD